MTLGTYFKHECMPTLNAKTSCSGDLQLNLTPKKRPKIRITKYIEITSIDNN